MPNQFADHFLKGSDLATLESGSHVFDVQNQSHIDKVDGIWFNEYGEEYTIYPGRDFIGPLPICSPDKTSLVWEERKRLMEVVGKRMKHVLTRDGYDVQRMAERYQITTLEARDYLEGKRMPSLEFLTHFARWTHTPITFFIAHI